MHRLRTNETTPDSGPEEPMEKVTYAYELKADTWDRCDNLWLFGEFFADESYCHEPPPDRKFRLMVVAALRAVWEHLSDPRSRAAVEASEEYADTQEPTLLTRAEQDAEAASKEVAEPWDANDAAKCLAHLTAWMAWQSLDPDFNSDPGCPPWVETVTNLETDDIPGRTRTQAAALHLRLFRDIFGNPFRHISIKADWLTPTVTSLAVAAYEERSLPSGELESARLGVLADALEDAGCDNANILTHLRGPGPHVRGCWAVDLLTGRS
jgi:hypothetical protein